MKNRPTIASNDLKRSFLITSEKSSQVLPETVTQLDNCRGLTDRDTSLPILSFRSDYSTVRRWFHSINIRNHRDHLSHSSDYDLSRPWLRR